MKTPCMFKTIARLCAMSLILPAFSIAGTLSSLPLNVRIAVPPTVMFALSVEFPTAISAAYFDSTGYSPSNTYLGYFDADKCYNYDITNQWFAPAARATRHLCGSSRWSGNLLNWATMTSLDEFRYAMTGGNRFVDTATTTVLERSYESLQGTASNNFPDKSYTDTGGSTPYATTVTFQNWNQGVNVVVTAGGPPEVFAVRVKVCDAAVSLESNCQRYGTSSQKPVGEIQRNGERMRFGVTSYYTDFNPDNAVLRSKAKFVAPTLLPSPSVLLADLSASTTNPYMEWSSLDGTFYRNPANCDAGVTGCVPDTDTTNSAVGPMADTGVINYINKFGTAAHSYKYYDSTSKLYYETLNYLQGGPPTHDFNVGATAASADGFPVITRWDDPQTTGWQCQKNFIVAMGDTHTWCDKRLPGGLFASDAGCSALPLSVTSWPADQGSLPVSATAPAATIDVGASTQYVGDLEGIPGLSTALTGSLPSAGYYIAGLASWAASHDIRTGASTMAAGTTKRTVHSYIIDVEEGGDCGYQSQYWLAAKYGVPEAYDDDGNWLAGNTFWKTALALPDCTLRPPMVINADGSYEWPKQLLRGNDPLGMINSVSSAFRSIAAEEGSQSAIAQSSGSLDTGTGAYIYKAGYNTDGWSGDVTAYAVDTTGAVNTTAAWSASAKLPAPDGRMIISWNPASHTAFNFQNVSGALPTGMSAAQQALLNRSDAAALDGFGTDRLDFLRGDQSGVASHGWRARTPMSAGGGLLGDFVNSNPLLVGGPDFGYSFDGYHAFALLIRQ